MRIEAAILDVNLSDGAVTPVLEALHARGIPTLVYTGGSVPEDVRGRHPDLVTLQRVEPNSPAEENGLRPVDIIVSVNSQPANSPSDIASAWIEAQKQKKPILMRVRRDDQYLFVAIGA